MEPQTLNRCNCINVQFLGSQHHIPGMTHVTCISKVVIIINIILYLYVVGILPINLMRLMSCNG